ncbi:MAG: ThiF family adenylyltransferase [Sedimentisphaerales bacterium]|nr:ThiF family adenylyltransferase [Sedimentisphaerales bacterium]MBN2842625.1 ThiF family adenylyltransferase [Sedimentisphaerales bacterium]
MTDNIIDNSRYSRQVAFSAVGTQGQEAISRGRVLLIGCGALGTNIAASLVRSGIGSLHIVDPDRVELSNLQRQALFDEEDSRQGAFKAQAAVKHLARINSQVQLESFTARFDVQTAASFEPGKYDIILDGTDDILSRFFINDYAVSNNIPWIYGAVAGAAGMAAFFPASGNPCLRCVFDPPASRNEVDTAQTRGVIAPVVTMTTSIQCCWALKYLSGRNIKPLMAHYDIWADHIAYAELVSAGHMCSCCGKNT